MRKIKSVLCLVLVLAMLLGCIGNAFAAQKTKTEEAAKFTKTESSVNAETLGFNGKSFKELNNHKYADSDIVRAIIVLEGECEADVAEAGSQKAASQRVKLTNEHNTVRKAMKGISYELKHEFTTLLNGFSCDVAYGDLEAIAAIEGVKSVHIANSYAAPKLEPAKQTRMDNANIMTGNAVANLYGNTGAGIVVAVLDTGLNTTHEAFQDSLGLSAESAALTEERVAAAETFGKGAYLNAKVPFAYDYADKDNDVADRNGHGTHVSGTVVGYVGEATEDGAIEYSFVGGAPAAQLLSMKIFKDAGGGTTSDIYFDALEDAYLLGADVVNMSIGSQNGFTYDESLETEIFGNIYAKMLERGIIMSVAAGNEYSMSNYSTSYNGYAGYVGPEYTDYGTVASPSTYEGNLSVASVENTAYPAVVLEIDGSYVAYTDSAKEDADMWLTTFGDSTAEFVVVLGADGKISLGGADDYANIDVTGKIAVVSRGEYTFEEKVEFAANAGAIGCIVVNNQEGIISMSIETFEIPAVSVQQDALEIFMNSESKEVSSPKIPVVMENPEAYLMSDFSNWGTTPMLTLDPTMTSVGGDVYSALIGADDAYEVYSGTSMAAPNATATFATVLAKIYELNPRISKPEAAELAKSILLSTAEVLFDAKGMPYSPRKQGAGLGNYAYATGYYEESAYIVDPIKELGDDPEKTGVYEFSVTIKNEAEWDVYYGDMGAVVLCDKLAMADAETIVNLQSADSVDCTTTFSTGGVELTEFTLGAGETIDVDVTITLSDEMKGYFDAYYTSGSYVEGFVYFTEYYEGEAYGQIHATFLAYYGDWTDGPILEEADFMDVIEVENFLNTTAADAQGNTYADYGYTYANSGLLSFYTEPKTALLVDAAVTKSYGYAGDNILDYTDYNPKHIAFSTPLTDATFNYAETIYMEPYQLRNLEHLIMTVSDKETGEIYYVDDTKTVPKSYFDVDTYNAWMCLSQFIWDGKDASGNYVPSGTVATITFDAILPYNPDKTIEDVWTYDVTVDYTAPTIDSIVYDAEAHTVTVTATDENYLQGIYMANEEKILDSATFSSDVAGETFSATFDVSGIDEESQYVYVAAIDYATNETQDIACFFETGLACSITLVTPFGTETVACATGEFITFEEAPELAGHDFVLWTGEKAEGDISYEEVFDLDDPWFFADDTILLDEPVEYTLYSVYARIKTTALEKTNFYLDYGTDYSGQWAICGWNFDSDYDFIIDDPMALNENGETIRVADIEDAEIGAEYIEFFTNAQNIRFNFLNITGNYYAVQSVATGKFLATNANLEIVFTDELDLTGAWEVVSADNGYGSLMTNAGVANAVFVYDDEAKSFAIYDNSTPYYGEYYPNEWFSLELYRGTDVLEEYAYFTFGEKQEDAVIFYTNDVHTYIDKALSYDTIAALKNESIEDRYDTILVDAGDHAQGTAYGSMDKGMTIVELMNAAGYDYATLGNHEFDYGMEGAMNIINKAEYEFLSANFYHEKDGVRGENVLDAYTIVEMAGKKIALVGITTPESFTKTTPAYFQDENGNYIYGIAGGTDGAELYAAVQAAIDAAKAEGAEIVIALGHLGDDPASDPWNSEDVIANVSGLDAFIDGHSHSTVESKEVADKDGNTVILTQTGSYFDAIGKMTIKADGTIVTELITESDLSDAAVSDAIDAWMNEVDGLLGEVIAKNEVDFRIKDDEGTRLIRKQETNLGDFAADALYYLFDNMDMDVDVAIMNGGGIRADMPVGDVSYKTTKTVHTFGNVACLQTITGQQLLDALEWGAKDVGNGENGGFLHVSGITYEIHSYIPSTVQKDEKGVWCGAPTGEYRVKNVMVGGEPLDVNAKYNLAGYNYTLRDLGDGFAMFDGAVNVLDYVMEDYLVLANYAKSFPDATIKADNSVLGANYGDMNGEGRIAIITEKPADPKPEDPKPEDPKPEDPKPEDPHEHAWDAGVVTKAATCTAEGEKTFTCACGETKIEKIAKLACSCVDYSDLDAKQWYHDAIDFMINNKYMNGVGDNKFAPNATLTRGMVVTVLYRMAGAPAVEKAASFTDVKAGEWYADAVAWAEAKGVVKGISATSFAPNAEITREQIATILYRYAGAAKVTADMSKFGDANKISSWAIDAMNWAVKEGIFSGDNNSKLNPTDDATRAEFATIMFRYVQ